MKLHIGGKQKKEGWKILNIQSKDGADFIGDITDLSQFEDNSIDEIYASHVVEHVDQNKMYAAVGQHPPWHANCKNGLVHRNTLGPSVFFFQGPFPILEFFFSIPYCVCILQMRAVMGKIR